MIGLNLPISSYNHIEIGHDVICSMNNFAVTIQTNGQIGKPSNIIKDHEMGFNFHFESSLITPNHYYHPFQSRPGKSYLRLQSLRPPSLDLQPSEDSVLIAKTTLIWSQVIGQGQRCKMSPVIVKFEKEPDALSTNQSKHQHMN